MAFLESHLWNKKETRKAGGFMQNCCGVIMKLVKSRIFFHAKSIEKCLLTPHTSVFNAILLIVLLLRRSHEILNEMRCAIVVSFMKSHRLWCH